MKTYAEIILSGDRAKHILSALEKFCGPANHTGWSTDKKKNTSSSEMQGKKVFWAIPPANLVRIPVGLALVASNPKKYNARKAKAKRMRLLNIVPLDSGNLHLDDYNAIAAAFVAHFRAFLRTTGITGLRIKFMDGELGLHHIITATATREQFQLFLDSAKPNGQPGDFNRLDLFTASLFRNRSKARPGHIRQFLVEDRGWSEKDADCVHERIRHGLEALRANAKSRTAGR